MGETLFLFVLLFTMGTCIVMLLYSIPVRNKRQEERLDSLIGHTRAAFTFRSALAMVVKSIPKVVPDILMPSTDKSRTRLRKQLYQAGCYNTQALRIYAGVRMLAVFLPWILAILAIWLGWSPPMRGMFFGFCASALGLLVPNWWLENRIKKRQKDLRHGIPDLLDVLLICLEGGLSLPASFKKVTDQFENANRDLGTELKIVNWEVQMGISLGDAMEHFAERSGVDEIRGLATMFSQNEQYGAGLITGIQRQSETFRFIAVQQIEEQAQKAATKILFPTLLFIFPGIFVVVLGPAALQIQMLMAKL